ncbi:MAG: putative bifunctional diguanylate cyclase/phosphodiesterase [Gammaproteobacteria bacterium]
MRASLIVTIVTMGIIAVALAVVSGAVYRQHAIDNERNALVEQIRIRLGDIRLHLDAEARGVALALAAQPGWHASFRRKDIKRIATELVTLFKHPTLAAYEMYATRLHVLDGDLNPLASATAEGLPPAASPVLCEHLRLVAQRRKGAERAKPFSGNCVVDRHVYYAAILPLGEEGGYLQLEVDLLKHLAMMETGIGTALRLSFSDGSVLYQSPNWPAASALAHSLIAEYPLNAYTASKTYLVAAIAKDEQAFYGKLAETNYWVLTAAAGLTILSVVVALMLLEKTAINPLRVLTQQLRGIWQDESQLGERVSVSGNAEVVELAKGFNEMTTKLEKLYENLEQMAFTDPLTQLPNRTLFQDRLQQTIAAARRDNKPFSLFIMDLDRFKDINDTLGHHIGDMLLQQVAQRLRTKLRESDTVARMGGDEFAVLLPTVSAKHADMAARMLLQALRTPFVVEEHSLDIGTSIGIALYPDHGIDANVLVQRADVAMYAAKTAGCGHAFYDTRMDQHHPRRLALMGELRQAVEQEQFVLYYQPKISLTTNRVVGVEALVRWRHPNGSLVLPDTFIPLLEQTGLIRNLTGWVMEEALGAARELYNRNLSVPISVNLSARDLQDPHLADDFAEQLAVHNAPPSWLELEITESGVMVDAAASLDLLHRLSAMGLMLSIDDFGTGYSSLAYLKKLPVQAVKIDKSFIMGMMKDDNDRAIVNTGIDLAHNLGLQVVAEGVDDEGLLNHLRSRGCDVAQGHYISRPLLLDELTEWLQKSSWASGTAHQVHVG